MIHRYQIYAQTDVMILICTIHLSNRSSNSGDVAKYHDKNTLQHVDQYPHINPENMNVIVNFYIILRLMLIEINFYIGSSNTIPLCHCYDHGFGFITNVPI